MAALSNRRLYELLQQERAKVEALREEKEALKSRHARELSEQAKASQTKLQDFYAAAQAARHRTAEERAAREVALERSLRRWQLAFTVAGALALALAIDFGLHAF